jgi:hypothetical protein
MRINAPGGTTKAITTARLGNHAQALKDLSAKYLHFQFDPKDGSNVSLTGKKTRIMGVQNGAGARLFSVPFAGLGAFVEIDNDWTIDLATSTIDLATFTGGRIDGIAIENDRDYLIWAFLDDNLQFAGIGATRKPYSAFTSAGAGAKGASFVVTVTNGFQFTIGARVVLRNNRGTSPVFEWNWGTITAQTNTTLTVLLDNNTYGVAFTTTGGGDGGVVQQWDTFRPWVVTTTEQTLYANHYSLLGECSTDSTVILVSNRVDDPHRCLSQNSFPINRTTSTGGIVDAFLGRLIPLWADDADLRLIIQSTVITSFLDIYNTCGSVYRLRIQATGVANEAMAMSWELYRDARLRLEASLVGAGELAIIGTYGYWVHGGMRR